MLTKAVPRIDSHLLSKLQSSICSYLGIHSISSQMFQSTQPRQVQSLGEPQSATTNLTQGRWWPHTVLSVKPGNTGLLGTILKSTMGLQCKTALFIIFFAFVLVMPPFCGVS